MYPELLIKCNILLLYLISSSGSMHVGPFTVREVVVVAIILFINPVNDRYRVAPVVTVKRIEFLNNPPTYPHRPKQMGKGKRKLYVDP